ncbi:hypothetical protein AWB91_08920 [Mycobacterium paraense]|uniref:Uncharacterized protein n=1 Tax=Mycobacterium paraense TaxID=767916 RepID=A0ABX3VU92_9MYCO|nr:hypothetical protein [Mycobacterium paraense]ORW33238.1 hypothetical protein AWB91_08920 [Mycobacterium paraense]ORW38429.1 hypothetical protein AWB88_17795 [Mycobacterium paraense]
MSDKGLVWHGLFRLDRLRRRPIELTEVARRFNATTDEEQKATTLALLRFLRSMEEDGLVEIDEANLSYRATAKWRAIKRRARLANAVATVRAVSARWYRKLLRLFRLKR